MLLVQIFQLWLVFHIRPRGGHDSCENVAVQMSSDECMCACVHDTADSLTD